MTHSVKGSRRYRYYVSNRMISGPPDSLGWRLPAASLEQQISAAIAGHLQQLAREHRLLAVPELVLQALIYARVQELAEDGKPDPAETTGRLLDLLVQAQIGRDCTRITLSAAALAAALGIAEAQLAENALHIECLNTLRRRGVETRLVIAECPPQPDPKLVAALGRTHRWLRDLRAGRNLASLTRADGVSEACLRSHLQLAFLASAIHAVILDGTQPERLTLHRLTRPEVPSDWEAQYQRSGIVPPG